VDKGAMLTGHRLGRGREPEQRKWTNKKCDARQRRTAHRAKRRREEIKQAPKKAGIATIEQMGEVFRHSMLLDSQGLVALKTRFTTT